MRCNAPDPAGGANSALPDQTSWLDLGEGKEGEKGAERERKGRWGKKGKEKNGSGSEKRGRKEKGTKGREGGGRKEKGRNLCSCDFS